MTRRAVRVTPSAANDLRDIGRYTLRRWGKRQRDAYLRGLDERFKWLAENPFAGKARPELRKEARSFPHQSHIVVYIVRDEAIEIIGVPHAAMDLDAFFGEEGGHAP